jgi:hypothetical protein
VRARAVVMCVRVFTSSSSQCGCCEGKGRGEVHVRVGGVDEGAQAVRVGRRGRPCMSEGRTRLCSGEGRRAVRVGRQGTSEAQLRLERGPYEAQTERWYHFG